MCKKGMLPQKHTHFLMKCHCNPELNESKYKKVIPKLVKLYISSNTEGLTDSSIQYKVNHDIIVQI